MRPVIVDGYNTYAALMTSPELPVRIARAGEAFGIVYDDMADPLDPASEFSGLKKKRIKTFTLFFFSKSVFPLLMGDQYRQGVVTIVLVVQCCCCCCCFFFFFFKCKKKKKKRLYVADNYHPSLTGSYLNSLVFYATIFGRSPRGIDFAPPGISPVERAYLQDVAHRATFG